MNRIKELQDFIAGQETDILRKLRHHGKRRHKKGSEEHRGKFVISHPIEERPASATNRSVRDHWEAATKHQMKSISQRCCT